MENTHITKMSFQVGLIEISIRGRSHEQAFVPEQGPYVSATSAISSACLLVQCICLGQIPFVISFLQPGPEPAFVLGCSSAAGCVSFLLGLAAESTTDGTVGTGPQGPTCVCFLCVDAQRVSK